MPYRQPFHLDLDVVEVRHMRPVQDREGWADGVCRCPQCGERLQWVADRFEHRFTCPAGCLDEDDDLDEQEADS